MVNNYEAPEVVEIGEPKDVILGIFKQCCKYDSNTQQFNWPYLADADD